jgi:hypothetical protein
MDRAEYRALLHKQLEATATAIGQGNPEQIMRASSALQQTFDHANGILGMGLADALEIISTINRRHSPERVTLQANFFLLIAEMVQGIRADHLKVMQKQLLEFLNILRGLIDHLSPLGFSAFWGMQEFPNPNISHERTAHGAVMHLLLQQKSYISRKLNNPDFDQLQEKIDTELAQTADISECIIRLGKRYNFEPEFFAFENSIEAIAFIQGKIKEGYAPLTQLRSRLGHIHFATILDIEIESDVGFVTTADELQIPLNMLAQLIAAAPIANTVWSILPGKKDAPSMGDLKLPPRK